ncbi:MAG: selenocysteine-specific translation elongation factor, partial [Pollutimonas bauzanensis]
PLANGDILGFIDVPGHERLVHTMVAGASGIDFGLLIVAADDGVMPQTREHLAILDLLGVRMGAVAVTKADRADAARLQQLRHDIAGLVGDSFLRDAPVFAVNAAADDAPGVAALRTYLHDCAQAMPARSPDGLFRLAVDRVFTLQGHGTVVTGTVHGGRVRADDDAAGLRLMPAGRPVRVRSIHAQNRPSAAGCAGQRCALNLGGVDKAAVARGDWIADARCFAPSRNIDAQLRLLASADAPVRAWSPLHVHLGAAHYLAHVVPLAPETLAPGLSGKVQLVFDEDICAMPGDRYIVRNAQARLTVGGGVVLDPNAPDRRRRAPRRLAWLDAVLAMLAGSGVSTLLAQAPQGLDEGMLMRLMGVDTRGFEAPPEAQWIGSPHAQAPRTLILRSDWAALADRAEQALEAFHQAAPDEPGLESARLRRKAVPGMPDGLWQALRDDLLERGRVLRNGPWLYRPGHTTMLSDADERLAARLLPLINDGGFDPPWARDLARTQNEPEDLTRQLLRKLVRRGELFQIVRDLFYHREQVARMARLIHSKSPQEGVSAAEFRDATGLGRKR